MKEIYKDTVFTIFKTNDGFLLQNHTIDGFAHTHLKNYNTALRIIELSFKKKCPRDLPRYLVISLYRVNDDEKYKEKIEQILNIPKKQSYYNKKGAA